jgi:hypothetical protein
MDNEIVTEAAPVARALAKPDLSGAIEGWADKEFGEEVRSVRVFDDNYRCNWWVRDGGPGPTYFNVARIIKSKFLRAIMTGEKLVVEDLSSSRRV